jgi:DNA-directed RNA polymerase specialized sigma24 family protein
VTLNCCVARGDPTAFRVVYDRPSRAVYGWLFARSGREGVALDLTAETFAETLRLAGKFRAGEADARPWRIGIAANLLHSSWRHQRAEVRARERLGGLEQTPLPAASRHTQGVDADFSMARAMPSRATC